MIKEATLLLNFLTLILSACAIAQNKSDSQNIDTTSNLRTRNIIFYTPVGKNTKINGVAIGFLAMPLGNAQKLEINGLNIQVNPISGTIFGFHSIIGILGAPFSKADTNTDGNGLGNNKTFPTRIDDPATIIRGLSLSIGAIPGDAEVKGVSIELISSFANKVEGLEVTGLVNLHYQFKGVMIAGLRNKATTGKGLQIGLVNTCKNGKLVQVGLINKIGKRVLPFLNLSL